MPSRFDADSGRRIGEVVRAIEAASAAEVIVEIRSRSGSYEGADARFAALLALLSLVVLVFMPFTVPPIAVILDPIGFYALGALLSRRSHRLRRLFTTRARRDESVHTRAAALFHDRRVSHTEAETGVLFYASVLEQRIEVLADRGVLRRVVPNDWNAALADLRFQPNLDADVVVEALERIGALLSRDLPAGTANPDELSNNPEIFL